ncbi:16S rRNA (cytosine(1402)-N(4))-methyltransferase, partial [Candidatus Falkowbacteria bacterium]|nr:16S rRNA (cytosine(1402)-N(4))-methyltransferase [Candidatus Falkowbacteria bacterium]
MGVLGALSPTSRDDTSGYFFHEIMEFLHTSVLLNECIEQLAIKKNGNYVDATLGGAGHSKEILVKNSPKGLLIGIDRDPASIRVAKERLSSYSDRVKLFNTTYDHINQCVTDSGLQAVDGVLMDLGLSSYQISDESRGFSFMKNGPLDMRMGSSTLSAASI